MKKIILTCILLLANINSFSYANDQKNIQKIKNIQNNNIEISAKEAKKALIKKTHVFIDVREQWEYDNGHIKGVNLIPMSNIDANSLKLDKSKKYITVCGAGVRSKTAAEKMKKLGLNVVSMSGGMNEWSEKGYPVNK